MTDLLSALREFRVLEERRATAALTEAELARWGELRTALGPRAPLVAPPPEMKGAPRPAEVPPLIDADELEEVVAVVAPVEPPKSSPSRPPIASRFPSLLALESEVTDPERRLAAPPEPASWEKTQPAFPLSAFPPEAAAPSPAVEPAREITAQVHMSELVPPSESPQPSGEPAPPAGGQPIFAALLAEATAAPSASLAAAPPGPIGLPAAASSNPAISIPTVRIQLPLPPNALPPADEPLPVEPPPTPEPPAPLPEASFAADPTPAAGSPTVQLAAVPLETPPAPAPLQLEVPLPAPASPLPLSQQLDVLAWGTLPSLVPSFEPVATPPPPTPIALDSPVVPLALDTPITPIALGSAVAPIALSVEAPVAEATAPEAPVVSPGFGPSVLPIALGSPLAPVVPSGRPERPLDPASWQAPDEPLGPPPRATPPEPPPEPPRPLLLVPVPEPVPLPEPEPPPSSLPDWLVSDPVAMVTAPYDSTPRAPVEELEQPTVVLGPAADPKPEPQLPFAVEGPTSPGGAPSREPPPRRPSFPPPPAAPPPPQPVLPKIPPARLDPEVTEDDLDLPMVVPEEELPPAPQRPASPSQPPPPVRAAVPPTAAKPVEKAALFDDYLRAPSVIPGEHRVVVHTVAGPLKRGTLREPDMESDQIDLVPQGGGNTERIAVGLVKAVFFMLAPGQEPPKPEGKRVTVNFEDGRQLFGFCPRLRDSDPGFFLLPADNRANTARIYVFRAAVKSIIEAKAEVKG